MRPRRRSPYPQTLSITINTYTNRRIHINRRTPRKTEVARNSNRTANISSMLHETRHCNSNQHRSKIRNKTITIHHRSHQAHHKIPQRHENHGHTHKTSQQQTTHMLRRRIFYTRLETPWILEIRIHHIHKRLTNIMEIIISTMQHTINNRIRILRPQPMRPGRNTTPTPTKYHNKQPTRQKRHTVTNRLQRRQSINNQYCQTRQHSTPSLQTHFRILPLH